MEYNYGNGINVSDVAEHLHIDRTVFYKEFKDLGTNIEPELIDFDGENCYYSDHFGNLYKILWS